jgi:hypothetical protein
MVDIYIYILNHINPQFFSGIRRCQEDVTSTQSSALFEGSHGSRDRPSDVPGMVTQAGY